MSEKANPEDRDTAAPPEAPAETAVPVPPKEIGGREGPEPVRYGDWEKGGRCIDF